MPLRTLNFITIHLLLRPNSCYVSTMVLLLNWSLKCIFTGAEYSIPQLANPQMYICHLNSLIVCEFCTFYATPAPPWPMIFVPSLWPVSQLLAEQLTAAPKNGATYGSWNTELLYMCIHNLSVLYIVNTLLHVHTCMHANAHMQRHTQASWNIIILHTHTQVTKVRYKVEVAKKPVTWWVGAWHSYIGEWVDLYQLV